MVPIAQKLGGSVLQVQGHLLNYAEIPLDADLYDLSVEELLEVTGGHVMYCGPFNVVCEEADIYQLWTQDYVQHLGNYLLDRCSDGIETTVVDIGAGDGLLVHFLLEYMEAERTRRKKSKTSKKLKKLPTVVATDDGSWGIFAKAQVEKLNVQDSLAKYRSRSKNDGDDNDNDNRRLIVLCSWMPMGQDWSTLFRDVGVDEYILIGEADDGTCGNNWETWGNPTFRNDQEDDENKKPPCVVDGYQRWDMDALSQFQFSRFDCAVSRSSKTVSFRKKR
jgi:hypothetical protein